MVREEVRRGTVCDVDEFLFGEIGLMICDIHTDIMHLA